MPLCGCDDEEMSHFVEPKDPKDEEPVMKPSSRTAWFIVAAVGVVVVALVFVLGLFPRLYSAAELVKGLRPAFTQDRVQGDVAAIGIVSDITDLADPITTNGGTAAAEVPKLIAFVSEKSGLPQPAVQAALAQNFPHLNDLLLSLPLSAVSAELPGFIAFLSDTLKMPPDQVDAAIKQNFPGLAQVIAALPKVTNGWDHVPGTQNLTRFNGSKVTTVPEVRDYFALDVIPVLQTQRQNFESLNGLPGGPKLIPPLLLVLGIVVAIFGLVMAFLSERARGAPVGWVVVMALGILVCILDVGILGLFSRLDAAQKLLNAAAPAFTQDRVQGDVAAIGIVSDITDLADPITTNGGTAAAEVPKLIAFVSEKSGLPQPAVQAALAQNFPHLNDLLLSLPLSAVSAELPGFIAFLSDTLKMPPDQVDAAIKQNFPGLAQVIAALPKVTNGWDHVPGTQNLTRFNGSKVTTVPEVRDYFALDVIPAVKAQQHNFQDVNNPFPKLTVFPPLLLAVGLLVTVYGAVMFFFAVRKR
jgi:hypothetical protein